MGRKHKPRELAELEGAIKKNPQRYRDPVPTASSNEPQRPEHLTTEAGSEWDRMEQVMRSAGLWSASYQVTIELYCETYANYRKSLTLVEKTGLALVRGKEIKRNPFSVELHKYKEETLKLLAELGLTPSSRSRITLQDRDNEADDFLKLLA